MRQRLRGPEERGLAALEIVAGLVGWTCQILEVQIPLGQRVGEETGATCASFSILAQ